MVTLDNLQHKKNSFVLDQKTSNPVLLSSLIATENSLDLTITIPKNKKITIIDDLKTSGNIEFIVHEHAQLSYTLKVLDQTISLFQRSITTTLIERHSSASVTSFFHGKDHNKIRFKTMQNHTASDTSSTVCVKGALDDHAQLFCQSVVRVEKNIHNVHAEQLNKNLLLSSHARTVAIPMLEVLSKHVACHHGAAISNLDENHLFYLESKGFSPLNARELLVEAFLNS